MPFDRADADEQFSADLGVAAPVAGEPGDVLLLRCELVLRVDLPLAELLAGGQQLPPCPFCERLGTHGREHLVRGSELLARVDPATLAAKPLAVDQMGAGELRTERCAGKPRDRLDVPVLRRLAVAEQCSAAGFDARRPVGAGDDVADSRCSPSAAARPPRF